MEFINMTIGDWMDKVAAEHPDQPAVIFTHDFDYKRTYKEFNDEAHTIAKAFLSMGIKKGDHVAIWATNYPQWQLTLFACAKSGVFNLFALVLPLVFVRPVLTIAEFFRKTGGK